MTFSDAVGLIVHQSSQPNSLIWYGMPERVYHADPCPEPSFSASIGKVVLDQSPLHAYLKHPRLGVGGRADEENASPEMQLGTAVHSFMLGVGAGVACIDAPDFRSKAAQEERAYAEASGKIALKKSDYKRAHETAAKALSQLSPDEATIFAESHRECVIAAEFANLQGHGRAFARGRIDLFRHDAKENRIWIRDIKTTADCSERAILRRITDGRLAMQMACYEWLSGVAFPEAKDRISAKLYFVETSPPHSLVTVELDDAFRKIGRSQLGRAWDTWQRCIATGRWPSYLQAGETRLVGPPTWLEAEEMDEIT